MSQLKRSGLVILALLLLVTFLSSASAKEKRQAKTLRIGALICLTGWFSAWDQMEWKEAQVVRDILNERGGITVDGKQYMIELVVEDCKSTNDGVAAAATKLIYDEKIKFIVGPGACFVSAAKDVCESAKAIRAIDFTILAPGELGPNTPYTFLCTNATIEHTLVAADYLKETYPSVKSLDFVCIEDGTQIYGGRVAVKMLRERGYIVSDTIVSFSPMTVDFSPIAAKLAASKSDAIFLHNSSWEHDAQILKGIRELGCNKPVILALRTDLTHLKVLAGEKVVTNVFSVSPYPGMPNEPPVLTEIHKRMVEKYGPEISCHFFLTNSVWCLAKAIEAAQSFDTDKVKATWENLDTIDTPWGTGYMGGLRTYGIRHAVTHPQPIQYVLEDGVVKFGGWREPRVP